MMPRLKVLFPIALATLSATAFTAASVAQAAYPAGPGNTNPNYMQSQPAPVERAPMPGATNDGYNNNGYNNNGVLSAGQTLATSTNIASAQPAPGVYLRVGQNSAVEAVAVSTAEDGRTELRVEHGIANVGVHNAEHGAELLVDLPGGQTALLKNGLYTFNANSNTVRVLKGEADAYPGSKTNEKPIKVKEDHAVTFNGPQVKPIEFEPFQARTDLIPLPYQYANNNGEYGGYPAYGPYGDGFFYGYPYYAYGYPGPYGFWGYGYPFGLGFGYYGGGYYGGGFRGGGFRGGGGGFHGGGGHR